MKRKDTVTVIAAVRLVYEEHGAGSVDPLSMDAYNNEKCRPRRPVVQLRWAVRMERLIYSHPDRGCDKIRIRTKNAEVL